MVIEPLNKSKNLVKQCVFNSTNLEVFEDVVISEIREKPYTYLGIEMKQYSGNVNSINIDYKFFIDFFNKNEFKMNHHYKLYTYKSFIVRYEVLD